MNVELHHGFNVIFCFGIVGNPVASALHCALASVVGSHRQFKLTWKHFDQVTQIGSASLDIGFWICQFYFDRSLLVCLDTIALSGWRHQLHQPHSAFG